VGGVGLVDPDLGWSHQACVEGAIQIEVAAQRLGLGSERLTGGCVLSDASMSAAAPGRRGRRNGEKRAKPNHASSHRKIRSGLIASSSSITRRVL
jgi:hypothetical protein